MVKTRVARVVVSQQVVVERSLTAAPYTAISVSALVMH